MLIQSYLNNLADQGRSANTIRLRRHYLQSLAATADPATATTEQISEWLDRHPDWSESSRWAAIVTVRAFYNWCQMKGLLDRNPAAPIRPIAPAHVNRPVIDEISLKRAMMLAGVEGRIMLRLGSECGLRVHEIAKVRMRDFDGPFLAVLGKGQKPRRVHCSPDLLSEIALLAREDWLFPSANGSQVRQVIYRRVMQLCGFPPHALRRRAADVLYRASGHDIRLVQKFLGHSSIETTQVYLGVDMEDLERASGFTRIAA